MENGIVLNLLNEFYSAECEIVGPTNVQDVADGAEFVSPEHASAMDLSDAIGTLIIATTFIKTVVDIFVVLKTELKRKPKTEEIEIKISAPKGVIHNIDEKTRKRLIAEIIKKL